MYNFTSIGAGVGGTEATIAALYSVIENLRVQKAEGKNVAGQSYSFALVDESAENIPGGVGFGREMSHFGDFNNPIRLSPNDFVDWVLNNKTLISSYIEQYGGLKGQKWLDTYGSQLEQAQTASDISELYLPRTVLGYFMEERLLDVMDVASKAEAELGITIKVDFWQGVANGYMPSMDGKGGTFTFGDEGLERLELVRTGQTFPKLRFEATGERQKNGLETERANISLGIAPPQQLATTAAQENPNYLWDFYAEGGTQKLLERIRAVQAEHPERPVTIHFLGSMAGLLESLPELEAMLDAGTINVKLISSSSKAETLQKAEFTAGKPAYQLAHFTVANASQFSSADAVLDGVREEFKLAKESGYGAYDAWTPILMGGVLNTIISKLSDNERERYDSSIHPKLREISRFTNPETVLAKESLESKGVLVMRSGERATGIEERNGQLVVKIDKDTGVAENMADIVVNVSGPLSPDKLTNISPLIRALSEAGAEIAQTGIKVENGFQVKGVRGISLSGTLAEGYNPNRQTIINAILNNARVIGSEVGTQIANQNQEMVYSGGVSARKNVMNAIRDEVAIPPREDNRIIVIDGLSGSGKSTLARTLAAEYNAVHFDSGYILKAAAKKMIVAAEKVKGGALSGEELQALLQPEHKEGRDALINAVNAVAFLDLADKELDAARYSTYARLTGQNPFLRNTLNSKIEAFSEQFPRTIVTGRDTGRAVYGASVDETGEWRPRPNVIKLFMEVSSKTAIERKVGEFAPEQDVNAYRADTAEYRRRIEQYAAPLREQLSQYKEAMSKTSDRDERKYHRERIREIRQLLEKHQKALAKEFAESIGAETRTRNILDAPNTIPEYGTIIINTDAMQPSDVARQAIHEINNYIPPEIAAPANELSYRYVFKPGSDRLNGALPQQALLDNRMVAETDNFFAIVGFGAFVPYLLIVPKDGNEHAPLLEMPKAMPQLPPELRDEFYWFQQTLVQAFKDTYGKEGVVVGIEHGNCGCTRECAILPTASNYDTAHFHLMLLPAEVTAKHVEQAMLDTVTAREIDLGQFREKSVQNLSLSEYWEKGLEITSQQEGKYVFLCYFGNSEHESKVILLNTANFLGSQFGREVVFRANAPHFDFEAASIAELNDEVQVYGNQFALGEITLEEYQRKIIPQLFAWQKNPLPGQIVKCMDELSAALHEIQSQSDAPQFGYKATLKPTRELRETITEKPMAQPETQSPTRWFSMPAWAKSALAASVLAGAGLTYFFSSNKPDGTNQLAGSTAMSNDKFNDYKKRYYEFKDHVSKLVLDLELKGVTDEGLERISKYTDYQSRRFSKEGERLSDIQTFEMWDRETLWELRQLASLRATERERD